MNIARRQLFAPLSLFAVLLWFAFATPANADIDCAWTGSYPSEEIVYGNFYHSGVTERHTKAVFKWCVLGDYYGRSMWNMRNRQWYVQEPYEEVRLDRAFPVYSPVTDMPLLMQTVQFRGGEYFQMISVTPKALLSVKDNCSQNRLSDNWMNPQCDKNAYRSEDRRNIYLLSRKEPYATAPTIQFYTYHTRLLLVARSASWEVTDFAYEDSKRPLSERTVRAFLKEKWLKP